MHPVLANLLDGHDAVAIVRASDDHDAHVSATARGTFANRYGDLLRNSAAHERRGINLCVIGLGGIFAWDLFFYSEYALFRAPDMQVWALRGFVNAVMVPVVVLGVSRLGKAAPRRRRRTAMKGRRPSIRWRRHAGRATDSVHRAEREIIARD